jgi:hypothetical protein
MYFPSFVALRLAQRPMYLTTWSGAPMQLAIPLRRLCDVYLKHGSGAAPTVVYASSNQAERAAAACEFVKLIQIDIKFVATSDLLGAVPL